jgi:hypothetical protein
MKERFACWSTDPTVTVLLRIHLICNLCFKQVSITPTAKFVFSSCYCIFRNVTHDLGTTSLVAEQSKHTSKQRSTLDWWFFEPITWILHPLTEDPKICRSTLHISGNTVSEPGKYCTYQQSQWTPAWDIFSKGTCVTANPSKLARSCFDEYQTSYFFKQRLWDPF